MNPDQLFEIRAMLEECRDYLDQRADADCKGDPPEYVPNQAMRIMGRVDELLEKLR